MITPLVQNLPARLPEKKKVNTQSEVPHKIMVSRTTRLLNLSFKYLSAFPKELFGVSELRELNLGNNNIEYIPDEISGLTNLRVAFLSRNLMLVEAILERQPFAEHPDLPLRVQKAYSARSQQHLRQKAASGDVLRQGVL